MNADAYGSDGRSSPGEISYDLVMDDAMSFVEGTCRHSGAGWQVFIFSRRDIEQPAWSFCTWGNGASGIVVRWPRLTPLNAASVEQLLSTALGVTGWRRVRGPDSMVLR